MPDDEFWAAEFAREAEREADEIVSDYPDCSLEALADGIERARHSYDGGPELAAAVIEILRRRAAQETKAQC